MKCLACSFLFLCIPLHSSAQSSSVSFGGAGFSETREIRYPTSYEVRESNVDVTRTTNPNQTNRPIVAPPVVVPQNFETREVGHTLDVQTVGVSGRVLLKRSADGRQMVTLMAENGHQFVVATGSRFKMGKRVFHAVGFWGGAYLLQDLSNKRMYQFVSLSDS